MDKLDDKYLNGLVSDSALKHSEINRWLFENKIVPEWVSTKVAALMLGISPNALRIRKCRGEIECRYFGKELRFNVHYLQRLFRDQRSLEKE